MRYLRLISLMVILAGRMLATAQEYIITNTFTTQRCIDDTPYYWRGQVITETGTYNDTVKHADPNWGTPGEIEQMKVTFTNSLQFEKVYEIKNGQKIEFRGKVYDKEGTYKDKVPATTTCDTTYKIIIKWSKDYHFYETVDICKTNVPYEWRGQKYYYTGEYQVKYQTKDHQNDSVYHLTLNVHIPYEQTKPVTICEDELPYRLGAQEIWEEGTYTDTLHPAYGCLEILHVQLSIAPRPYVTQEVTFCQNEGYKRGDQIYYDRRTFMDTIRRISGCDSIVETTCIPLPTYNFVTRAGHKSGEPYVWDHNGKTYTKDSNYYEFYKTKAGCDSIYALYLTTTTETHISTKVCQGDTIIHHGKIVTDSTIFPIRDTLKSITGGDSILLVTYQFMPRYYFLEKTTICQGDTIPWTGHTDLRDSAIYLTEAGSYYDRKKTKAGWGKDQEGCDSIYEIQVTVIPKYAYDTLVILCNEEIREEPFIWTDAHGKQHEYWKTNADTTIFETLGHTPVLPLSDYVEDNVWYRALSGGCDSTWRMRIITKECGVDTGYLCPGSSVWVNKIEYKQTGRYKQCVESSFAEACDSVCMVTIVDAIGYNSDYYQPVRVCQSELPYYWVHTAYGKTFSKELSKTGKYDLTLPTIQGCDSVIHIDFTVMPTSLFYEPTRNICRGDTTYINRVTQAGHHEIIPIWRDTTFRDTLRTQMGCDSIIVYTVNQVRDFFFDKKDHFPQGGYYWWHDHGDSIKLTQQGVYFDSCRTVNGCDSVYRLTLTWDRPTSYLKEDSVCKNNLPYHWHGMSFYTDTIVVDSLQTPTGMDSICTLRLKVLPISISDKYLSICKGDKITLMGQTIQTSGVYLDTLISSNRCDSIVRYHVNILPTYAFDEEIRLGEKQTYDWHGQTIHAPVLYKDSFVTDNHTTAQWGCDSIYRLRVIKDQSFVKREQIKICEKDTPYEWHGQLLNSSGDYIDRHEARPGVDSTYYLNLTIAKSYVLESVVNLCAGGTYSFFGRELTEPGVYEEEMTSTQGCDSIYRVTINRLPSYLKDVTISICYGETIQIADTAVSSACQFSRIYPSMDGCDSTVRYMVVLSSFKKTSRDSICEGNAYIWRRAHRPDTILTHTGTYLDVYPSASGCDSIFELILVTRPTYIWDTIIYVCPDETYMHKGKEYNITQVLSDTFSNQYGCDSIRNFHYKVMKYCTPEDNYLHCFGASIIIDGRNYTEDGTYRVPLTKDSVHRFTIASHPVYEYNKNIGSYCDSVIYEGTTYYARGAGYSTFTIDRYMQTVEYGCDSIEHVTMSIFKSAHIPTYKQEIEDYAYVIFDGGFYNTTGVYTHPYHTTHGCDSTLVLDLKVNATSHPGSLVYQYCALNADQPLNIFGKKYRPLSDTVIYDTIFIPQAPVMIIRKAEVEVEEPFRILTLDPEKEICATTELQFSIFFTHTGIVPKSYEFKFLDNDISATPKNQSGEVEPLSKSIRIDMNGQGSCIRPGIYPYELALKGKRCHLSDTLLRGEIMVRYPASIMEANWTDVVALKNETKNDGKWVLQAPYIWQVTSKLGDDKTAKVAPTDLSQPYIYSEELENGDKIIVTLMRDGYKYAIPSCEYTFEGVATNDRKPTLVTPTMVRKSAYVRLSSSSCGQYQLLDSYGHICQSGTYHDGEQQIQVPATAGCYIMQIISDNAAIKTYKIIVY